MSDKKLTPQQEKFCEYVAAGMYQSDAYRKAYPKSKASAKTMREKASKLMAQSNISTMVKKLQEETKKLALWTREDAIQRLKQIADGEERTADQVNAIKELNKMHGYEAPSKHEHTSPDGSMTPGPAKIEIVHVKSSNKDT